MGSRYPEQCSLSVPTPEELRQGGKRAPEAMANPKLFRALVDLLHVNPCRLPPTTGEWRVDLNQALFMAVMGESFSWEFLNARGEIPQEPTRYLDPGMAEGLERAMWAAGLVGEVALGPRCGGRAELVEPLVRAEIVEAISQRGLPGVLFTSGELQEVLLVTGYAEGGEELTAYRAEGGGPGILFEESQRVVARDWFRHVLGAIYLRGRAPLPPLEEVYRAALEAAVPILRRTQVGDWLSGQAMWSKWAEALVDPTLDADDDATRARRASLFDPLWCDLAERRWYGSLFLNSAADRLPAAKAELSQAAQEYQILHDLMWKVHAAETSPKTGISPATRREAAAVVREAAGHDAHATDLLEAACRLIS
ncbi:MAG TPA: hypothetical protein VGN26_06465 [Armatimonadota bacterium]|jgi:hypothetical protein